MDLKRAILKAIVDQKENGKTSILIEILQRNPKFQTLNDDQFSEIVWQLVAEGLVFLDTPHPQYRFWEWKASQKGIKVTNSNIDYEPDDPERYLQTLRKQIPELDEQVLLYAKEALGAYEGQCYLASTVMLGVASERAFQTLGEAFASWSCLPAEEQQNFLKVFNNRKRTYVDKFQEFRKRIEPRKDNIPSELSDNMALTLDSVLDLLRTNRNEAGHPTGKRFDQDEVYINLQIFARLLKKLYAFRDFFLTRDRQALL